jgi:hypothetical protein
LLYPPVTSPAIPQRSALADAEGLVTASLLRTMGPHAFHLQTSVNPSPTAVRATRRSRSIR